MSVSDVMAAFAAIAREEGAAQKGGGGYPAPTGQVPHRGTTAGASGQPQQENADWSWWELPPRPLDLAPSQYVPGLEMPGEGARGATCGTTKTKTACPTVAERSGFVQLPGAKPHTVAVTPHFCKSPRCAVCWPLWLKRAALRGDERLRAAQHLYCHKDPRHFTFSPPQKDACMRLRSEGVGYLKNLYRSAYATVKRSGLEGGLIVFHPWRCSGHGKDRYRTSARRLSPHFHVIGFGYTTPSKEFYAKTGWLMKNHNAAREKRWRDHGRQARPMDPLALLMYLLDHCGIEAGAGKKTRDALRAFGTVHQVKKVEERRIEETIKCASCNSDCWVYEPDPTDEDGFGHCIEVAVSVKVLSIYERHKRAKTPPDAPDQYYTLASEDPCQADPTQSDFRGAAAA